MPEGLDAIAEGREVDEREDVPVTPAEPDEMDYDEIDFSEDIQGDY